MRRPGAPRPGASFDAAGAQRYPRIAEALQRHAELDARQIRVTARDRTVELHVTPARSTRGRSRSRPPESDDTAMDVELVVRDSAAEVSRTVADLLVEAARADAGIVLAGGRTPRKAFGLAAAAEPDWGGAEIWLGDERLVPPDDPRSNARLVRDALLDRLAVPPSTHFVRTELPADDAAAAYDRELQGARLDFALLGLGPDGHTASLFPNAPALGERERLAVVATPGLEPWVDRVTMTLPALTSPAEVVFVVVGQEKAEAVRRAFTEPPSPGIPASLVRSASGRTMVILDRAAASEL